MLLLNSTEIRKKKSLANNQIDVIACVKNNMDMNSKIKYILLSPKVPPWIQVQNPQDQNLQDFQNQILQNFHHFQIRIE